jgi:hypothetical protein
MQEAVTSIAPAVLNGGLSTFLSIVLLADSNSHVFEIFFKVSNDDAVIYSSTNFTKYDLISLKL